MDEGRSRPSALNQTDGTGYRAAVEFGQNRVGGFGPDERFGSGIVLGEISIDSGLQVDDRAEDASAAALPGYFGKEVLPALSQEAEVGVKWNVQRSWRASQASTPAQPRQGLRMFM